MTKASRASRTSAFASLGRRYRAEIDDEGRCERTARLPVSRSSIIPKRLLRGSCTPIEEPTARLTAGRANNREVPKGSITPDAIGGSTVPCISSAHEPYGALSREEPSWRFR